MRLRKYAVNLCVSLAAIALSLLLLEVGVRSYHAARRYFARDKSDQAPPVRLHVETDAPYLYGLNPEHPDISPQGTRDDAAMIPKPAGAFRILVLGDSLAYASSIPKSDTFPNRLEALLKKQTGPAAEVVNAGVSGYGAYNELHYYLAKGREFGADIVVVAFCMNDVVNPRLHWGDAPFVKIPDAAIPNLDYDRKHILPRLQKLKEQQARPPTKSAGPTLLKHSELYRAIEPGLKRLFGGGGNDTPDPARPTPTYITGEDTISIEVLLDESSPEWRWLTGIYDQLHRAVREDRAELVVVLFPLAYQLDEGYPFFPQRRIAEYCERNSIPCLDLLPSFKRHRKEEVFLLQDSGYYDVWHLTGYGHELAAEEILSFMRGKGLLPAERKAE